MTSLALARHVIDRLGYGPRPGDLDHIATIGVDRWIEEQFEPRAIALPPDFADRLAEFTTAFLSPPQLFAEYGPPSVRRPGERRLTPEQQQERNRRLRFVAEQAIALRLARAIASPRQLETCLSDFWFNHFNVFLGKGLDRLWVGAYVEEAIRPHCLGRFRDLLGATAKHPAMLFYLDNWLNTAPDSPGARPPFDGINENYAREVMELHTLGVNGGYTQADVIALARIFTGWTIGPLRHAPAGRPFAGGFGMFRARWRRAMAMPPGRGTFVFDADRHDYGDKRFLGRIVKGTGIEEGEAALDRLAASPATAHHISFALAQYFLADDPDKAVVDSMARTFLASDGDIRAVLRSLFASAAFRAPDAFWAKFKSPYRYVVSAVRAGGIRVANFRPLDGTLRRLGELPYGCLTPDGYKTTEAAWLNPDAMMQRLSFAVALAAGHLPLERAPDAPADQDGSGQDPGALRSAASSGAGRLRMFDRSTPPRVHGMAIDAAALIGTLGDQFSENTRAAVAAAPPQLRAAMILGSPEFMRC